MNKENLLRLQASLDNELTGEESQLVRELLANDPDAQDVCRRLRETKTLLSGNEMPVKVPETREFYWSKIEREIARLEAAAILQPAATSTQWWNRLAVPIAGVAILILLLTLVLKPLSNSGSIAGSFHEIETPLDEANAISFHSQAAGMTVVWIDSRSN